MADYLIGLDKLLIPDNSDEYTALNVTLHTSHASNILTDIL